MSDMPKCPRCGTAEKVRPNGHRLWLCGKCDGLFDDSGDDGDIGYGRPEKRLEREDRNRLAKFAQACRRNAGLPTLKGGLQR